MQGSEGVIRYACPFFKKDRVRFRDCRTFGAPSDRLADITQHLKRHHKIYTCPSCFQVFDRDIERDEHIRAREPDCTCKDENPHFGISVTTEQMEKIQRRKKPKMNPDDRWNEIWGILFEEDNTTESPLVDPQDISIFSDFLECIERFDQQRLSRRPDGPEGTRSLDCCSQTLYDLRNFINHLREQERGPAIPAPTSQLVQQEQQVSGSFSDIQMAQWVHIDDIPGVPVTVDSQAAPSVRKTCDPSQLSRLVTGGPPIHDEVDVPVDPALENNALAENNYDSSWTSLGD